MKLPDRVAFSIFGKDIYWYAILLATGIIVAAIIASIEAKRKKMHPDTVIDICLWAIPLGIIGARLYYVLFELDKYLADPIKILQIWEGGLAIPGGILGGMLGIFIYSRIKKKRFLRYTDIIAPGLALAQAIGRWGNFFNQEVYGYQIEITSSTPWLLTHFPFVVRIEEVVGGQVVGYSIHLALFFYESVACLLIFLALWSMRKRVKHDGDLMLAYAAMYGFIRMILEGLREPEYILMLGSVRITQLLCFLTTVAVLTFFVIRKIREEKLGVIIWPKHIEYLDESKPEGEKEEKQAVQEEVTTPAEIVAEDTDLAEFGISPDVISEEAENEPAADENIEANEATEETEVSDNGESEGNDEKSEKSEKSEE
jgi:phosphatidylglycerol:prolipoprotein diacylglycerol transferase